MTDEANKLSEAELDALKALEREERGGDGEEADKDELPKSGFIDVTYHPDEHDPSITLNHGVRFKANMPSKVNLATHRDAVKLWINNPWFHVEGFDRAQKGSGKRIPKTAEEYRFHATEWFKRAPSAEAFQERWKAEEGLRNKCGVGEDDIEWLETLATPRLEELKGKDEEFA